MIDKDFRAGRGFSYFVVELPIHPKFKVTPKVTEQATTEATMEVTTEVEKLLSIISGKQSRQELQKSLGLKNDEHFRKAYLVPAIKNAFIEMTIPDKPTSSEQKYRLTKKGKEYQEKQ